MAPCEFVRRFGAQRDTLRYGTAVIGKHLVELVGIEPTTSSLRTMGAAILSA